MNGDALQPHVGAVHPACPSQLHTGTRTWRYLVEDCGFRVRPVSAGWHHHCNPVRLTHVHVCGRFQRTVSEREIDQEVSTNCHMPAAVERMARQIQFSFGQGNEASTNQYQDGFPKFLKRRKARTKLEEERKKSYESRHLHALKRVRGKREEVYASRTHHLHERMIH